MVKVELDELDEDEESEETEVTNEVIFSLIPFHKNDIPSVKYCRDSRKKQKDSFFIYLFNTVKAQNQNNFNQPLEGGALEVTGHRNKNTTSGYLTTEFKVPMEPPQKTVLL